MTTQYRAYSAGVNTQNDNEFSDPIFYLQPGGHTQRKYSPRLWEDLSGICPDC